METFIQHEAWDGGTLIWQYIETPNEIVWPPAEVTLMMERAADPHWVRKELIAGNIPTEHRCPVQVWTELDDKTSDQDLRCDLLAGHEGSHRSTIEWLE